MTPQEAVRELVSWEDINSFSTASLVAEWGNWEEAEVKDDGNISIKNACGRRWLNDEEIADFLAWLKKQE